MRSREECRKDGGRRNETHDEDTTNYILNGKIKMGKNIYGNFGNCT